MFNVASSFKKFWNTNYFQNEPKFNGVYSRSNLPKIKVGAYVITLHEYKSIGTLWIALHVNGNNRRAFYDAIYFDSFDGVEHMPKEIKETKIYRKQKYHNKYL